jgi:hypothetical protein
MTSMTVKGAWKGWHGQTIVEMTDGSKWKQFDADQATEVRHVSVCGFRRCLTVPLQDILDGFGRCRIWFY